MVWSTEWTKICSVQRRLPMQRRGAAPVMRACPCALACRRFPREGFTPSTSDTGSIKLKTRAPSGVRGKAADVVGDLVGERKAR